jgi:hypothetical protein
LQKCMVQLEELKKKIGLLERMQLAAELIKEGE